MKVGPYILEGVLGAGGMGTVHRGRHAVLEHDVAVKELTYPDPSSRALFVQEARLLFGLKHPSFPTVYDLIEQGGATYLVMDFVRGPTLRGLLDRARLKGPEAALLGRGLCAALESLHGMGMLHRDIKPENIMLPRGLAEPVIVDFGIACRVGSAGVLAFTPGMAPPEQVAGLPCGPWSDVYQVGATLYACLTGAAPPEPSARASDDELGAAWGLVAGEPSLARPVRWALSLDPGHRPSSARQLMAALGEPPAPAPPLHAVSLAAPPAARRGVFDIRR
jgi:serine/threonine protein kinase